METTLKQLAQEAFQSLYGKDIDVNTVQIQSTKKEFDGDLTLVVFPLLRFSGKNPVETGNEVGQWISEKSEYISTYNVVKGFLNFEIAPSYWLSQFNETINKGAESVTPASEKETIMVEFASPNTNKPLHLGHLRNIFLGHSVSAILAANGHEVIRTQIINDRGIHICKSMYAWQQSGASETPESTGMKGDKLVGKYYVLFDKQYKSEIENLVSQGVDKEAAAKQAPSIVAAQDMLKKWESGDAEVVGLWKKMNGWVYDGFDVTYDTMNVGFDKLYYESDTYLLGKDHVEAGLKSGVFFKKDDGSVWCDLTDEGLDEKLVLRSDGTAVYMTQDIGTAIERFKDYPALSGVVYTVGNEQDYHFKVLFLILKKLGFDWAKNCYHLSYGMVDLPSGKMKSREGTVVDADDIMAEMIQTAKKSSETQGKLDGLSEEEKAEIVKTVGLGALKYFLLKVDPVKRMQFNPEESIELQGNTGPFIQYAYARTRSVLRREAPQSSVNTEVELHHSEIELIKRLLDFSRTVNEAGKQYSPAIIANYTYELAKNFNQFYQSVHVLNEENADKKNLRLYLVEATGTVIEKAMHLLGIQVPQRM